MKKKSLQKSPYQGESPEAKFLRIQKNLKVNKFIRENLYPFLLDNTTSFDDAKIFCSSVAMAIQQGSFKKLEEFKVKDIGLEEMLKKNEDPKVAKWNQVLSMLSEEDVTTAQRILNELGNDLELFARERDMKTSLAEVKDEYPEYVPEK